jgi:hypothetical protein
VWDMEAKSFLGKELSGQGKMGKRKEGVDGRKAFLYSLQEMLDHCCELDSSW